MGTEPGVDAGDMERVTTLGEQADALTVVELAEAHGAVGDAVEEAIAGPVFLHRDGTDGGLVEARRPDVPDMVERLSVANKTVIVVVTYGRRARGGDAEGEAAAATAEDGVVGDREEENSGNDSGADH